MKYINFVLSVCLMSFLFIHVSAQEVPTLTAALHGQTPEAKNLSSGSQYADVARITLTATGGDVFLNGIYINTDIQNGLDNFTNIYLYNATSGITLLGTYPNQSSNPNLIQFNNITIGSGQSKTFLVRASLSDTAAGQIRVGFSGATFATQATPTLSGFPIYGNVMTLPGAVVTPTPSPSVSPSPSATPSSTPSVSPATPASLGFSSLAALTLNEGDVVSSSVSGDPDIYIVNSWGYKRLFLNPAIFGFYGHLGGFNNVKNVSLSTRNMLVPSGLFRNCETNDPKVYGLEVTGEDTGTLHWINTSGEQAAQDDPDFFKKVFCINSAEFGWYQKGSDYASVNQVPKYTR